MRPHTLPPVKLGMLAAVPIPYTRRWTHRQLLPLPPLPPPVTCINIADAAASTPFLRASKRGNGNSTCTLASDLLRASALSPSPRSMQCGRSLFYPSDMLAAASQRLASQPHLLRAWRSQSPRVASHRCAHLVSTPGLRAATGSVRAAAKDVIRLRTIRTSSLHACLCIHAARHRHMRALTLPPMRFQHHGVTSGRLVKARVR